MEEQNQPNEEMNKAKQWFQDNLRIIISVIIVVVIAGGIYSYSKRTDVTTTDIASQEDVLNGQDAIGQDGTSADQSAEADRNKQVSGEATSQETDTAFIETAGRGNGMTHLARRALANYLEKNPDSTLTPEHKIYIEDFLRKNVPQKRIFVGTSQEFSKDQIQQAIAKSKTLNERQLQNLHKYAVRVPSLS